MCFSATGSFALAGVLTVLGATSLARNSSKPYRMFASIPLLFAVQQAAEGVVWVTLNASHSLVNGLAVRCFVGIALVVWPTWLPLALRSAERDPKRRRALGALSLAGGLVSSSALLLIARFPPFAQIAGHSINYEYAGSGSAPARLLFLLVYLVPTVVPFFVTTLSMARVLGVVLVLSLVTAVVVQRDALTSVWCFFAAILSGLILLALERERRALQTRAVIEN